MQPLFFPFLLSPSPNFPQTFPFFSSLPSPSRIPNKKFFFSQEENIVVKTFPSSFGFFSTSSPFCGRRVPPLSQFFPLFISFFDNDSFHAPSTGSKSGSSAYHESSCFQFPFFLSKRVFRVAFQQIAMRNQSVKTFFRPYEGSKPPPPSPGEPGDTRFNRFDYPRT